MIHENTLFTMDVPPKGAAKGHITYNVKSSSPEDIKLIGLCGSIAASILFEKLSAQGTNLIFNISDESSKADVLARYENDGIDLLWTPKQVEPSQIKQVAEKIKDAIDENPAPAIKKSPTDKPGTPPEKKELSEEEEEYLVKQITRIP